MILVSTNIKVTSSKLGVNSSWSNWNLWLAGITGVIALLQIRSWENWSNSLVAYQELGKLLQKFSCIERLVRCSVLKLKGYSDKNRKQILRHKSIGKRCFCSFFLLNLFYCLIHANFHVILDLEIQKQLDSRLNFLWGRKAKQGHQNNI